MCTYIPVTEVVKLPINWVRGDDERLKTVFKSLKKGDGFKQPIKLLRCGCGKTYILEDGGHRITAAHNSKVFEALIADGDLKQGCEVQADKAYRSKRHDAMLSVSGLINGVQHRAQTNRPLSKCQVEHTDC